MKTKTLQIMVRWALLLGSAVMLAGCATPALWKNEKHTGLFVPAQNTSLQLFKPAQTEEVLVVFEQQIANTRRRPVLRAYALFANAQAVQMGESPRFISVKQARKAEAIPMVTEVPAEPGDGAAGGYLGMREPSGREFHLYRDGKLVGSYHLPRYSGTKDKALRIILTPIAVGVDAAIVAACAMGSMGAISVSP